MSKLSIALYSLLPLTGKIWDPMRRNARLGVREIDLMAISAHCFLSRFVDIVVLLPSNEGIPRVGKLHDL